MAEFFDIYSQFLGYFPENLRWAVSLTLAILIVFAAYKVITRHFIFIILLIVLLPASIPIFRHIWETLVSVLKYLLTR
jgi:hypothetical protein